MDYFEVYEVSPGVEMRGVTRPQPMRHPYERHVTYTLHERGDNPNPVRETPERGSRCGCARRKAVLTQQQCREIKRAYARGNVTQADIARVYGVSQPYVSWVIRNK